MLSALPALSPGHYFSSFGPPVPVNPIAGSLTGTASVIRGTDPTGYSQGVLQQWGILAGGEEPAGRLVEGPKDVSWFTKGLVGVVAVAIIIIGVILIATESGAVKAAAKAV